MGRKRDSKPTRRVLALSGDGINPKAIAEQIGVSAKTVYAMIGPSYDGSVGGFKKKELRVSIETEELEGISERYKRIATKLNKETADALIAALRYQMSDNSLGEAAKTEVAGLHGVLETNYRTNNEAIMLEGLATESLLAMYETVCDRAVKLVQNIIDLERIIDSPVNTPDTSAAKIREYNEGLRRGRAFLRDYSSLCRILHVYINERLLENGSDDNNTNDAMTEQQRHMLVAIKARLDCNRKMYVKAMRN